MARTGPAVRDSYPRGERWRGSCTSKEVAKTSRDRRGEHVRLILLTALALTPLLGADKEPAKRLAEASAVFSEIMGTPDKGIPQELLEKAHCIVIVPGLKTAAFVFGGEIWKRLLVLPKQERSGLVSAGDGPH